ncbi:hypothetical protein P12x_004594 [Tundrisphaera lichenicola]|uniref:hypothetical protein n=1 Tax=Tundrisphaera lichenicola TaxID=2029860 RepID=UPI003EBFA089
MTCTPARLEANRRNATLSSGPKTEEGKARSRANALKHGLTGAGVVLPDEVVAEVDQRFEEFEADLKPSNRVGRFLARRAAMLSVRLDRCVRQESEAIASRMRRAKGDFERERLAEVDHALSWIAHEPATHARKLRSMPEGIDRMVAMLLAIKDELTDPDEPRWDWTYGDRVSHLMGGRLHDIPVSPVRALSEAIGGNFAFLRPSEGQGLDAADRAFWAREQMSRLIDDEVEALRALRESLDPASIEEDRAGAAARAIFDPSKEATLARKYEAAAERGLFRTLGEIRTLDEDGPPESEIPETSGTDPHEEPGEPARLGSFFPETSEPGPWPGPHAIPTTKTRGDRVERPESTTRSLPGPKSG